MIIEKLDLLNSQKNVKIYIYIKNFHIIQKIGFILNKIS